MTFWGVVLFLCVGGRGMGWWGRVQFAFGSQLRSPSAKYLQ